jgi:MtN3 and saliva related transmembrane protein
VDATSLGLIAGAFTTLAAVPQIVYSVRTGRIRDVSLTTLFMFSIGVALWLLYGITLRAIPVVLWNAVSLALYGILIVMRLRARQLVEVPVFPAVPSD